MKRATNALERGFCSLCGADVALRKGRLAREHVVAGAARPRKCRGSGALALNKRPNPARVAEQARPAVVVGDYVSARKLRPDGPGRLRGTVTELRAGLILLAVGDDLRWVVLAGARKLAPRKVFVGTAENFIAGDGLALSDRASRADTRRGPPASTAGARRGSRRRS